MLEHLLPLNNIKMFPDLRILPRKPLNIRRRKIATQPLIKLPGEEVIEFAEKLSVQEQVGGGCELLGHGVQEDLGAGVFVVLVAALPAADGFEAHFDDVGAVAEEACFFACLNVST